MNRSAAHRLPAGFTLLELLVAVSLSTLLLLGLVRLVSVSISATARTGDRVGIAMEQERIRRLLESDLQCAWDRAGWSGLLWTEMPADDPAERGWDTVPFERKPSERGIAHAATVSDPMLAERWGRTGARVGWLVLDPLKGMEDPGGLKAVGYQVVRKSIHGDAAPRYFLARSEVSAWNTMQAGYALGADAYHTKPLKGPVFWSPAAFRHAGEAHLVASNVIDFGVRAFRRNPLTGAWQQVFPGEQGTEALASFPERWVVMLRILSEEGAMRIENIEQGRDNADWWQTARQHSKVFSFQVQRKR